MPKANAQFLHDLAGPLAVLSLCLPELKKEWQYCQPEVQGRADPRISELLQLCMDATEEAKHLLKQQKTSLK